MFISIEVLDLFQIICNVIKLCGVKNNRLSLIDFIVPRKSRLEASAFKSIKIFDMVAIFFLFYLFIF